MGKEATIAKKLFNDMQENHAPCHVKISIEKGKLHHGRK
jgi:hypothetical protein